MIPSTTATAESSFSGLRRTKTSFRSNLGQEMLNNNSLLHQERGYANEVMANDLENIIDAFGNEKNRQQKFFKKILATFLLKYYILIV